MLALLIASLAISVANAFPPPGPEECGYFQYDGIWYSILPDNDYKVEIKMFFMLTKPASDEIKVSESNEPIDVIIPEKVEYKGHKYTVIGLGKSAFDPYLSIKALKLPQSIEYFDEYALCGCKIGTLYMPDSEIRYDDRSFAPNGVGEFITSDANPLFAAKDGILYTKDLKTLLCYPFFKTDGFTFPRELENIACNAFYSCNITSVDLPSGIKTIGSSAFFDSKLESVRFSSPVKIEDGVFYRCSDLKSVEWDISMSTKDAEKYQSLGESAFSQCN